MGTVGAVTVRLNLNKDGYSAGMSAARREAQATVKSIESLGHTTVSQMQASSAAIRTLEGGMQNSIRAAERFISTIPGVGAALQTAFPVFGGIAVAGIIARIGEEAYKSIEKVRQMNTAIQQGFDQITSSGKTANDQLALSNAKLQSEIDKLEHKPANRVAEALAEAKVQADQLYDSLRKDNEEIAKVLDANQAGFLAQLMGKAPSKQVKESIEDQMTQLETISRKARDTSDPAERASENAHLMEQMKVAVSWIEQAKKQNPNGTVGGVDFSGNFNALDAAESVIKQRYDNIQVQQQHDALTGKKEGIGDSNSAQAQLLKQDEEDERRKNAHNKMTINEEITFWNDRIAAFTKGGEQYIAVQDKIYDLIASRPELAKENKKNQAEVGKSQVEGGDLMAAGAEAFQKINLEQMDRAAKSAEKYNEEVAKGDEMQQKVSTAFAEASVQMALAQGTMSKLDAAQALAAIHAQDHAEAIQRVNKALADQIGLINADPKLTAEDKAGAIRNASRSAQTQISAINGDYSITQQRDQSAIADQQLGPATTKALGTMVNAWGNMTEGIVQTMTKAVDGLNDQIVNAILGRKTNFGKVFSDAGAGLTKTALQSGESKIMGAFGLGKPDGTASNPIYTRDAGAGPGGILGGGGSSGPGGPAGQGGGGSIWSRLFHSFFGGGQSNQGGGASSSSSSSGSDSDGDGGGFDDLFQGSYESGGSVVANRPLLLGEKGPEMFVPPSAGRIVPNNQLGGRGGTSHTYMIDARGSNDPAAIHAAVARALPHAVAASMQAQHQSAKRSPQGR